MKKISVYNLGSVKSLKLRLIKPRRNFVFYVDVIFRK